MNLLSLISITLKIISFKFARQFSSINVFLQWSLSLWVVLQYIYTHVILIWFGMVVAFLANWRYIISLAEKKTSYIFMFAEEDLFYNRTCHKYDEIMKQWGSQQRTIIKNITVACVSNEHSHTLIVWYPHSHSHSRRVALPPSVASNFRLSTNCIYKKLIYIKKLNNLQNE